MILRLAVGFFVGVTLSAPVTLLAKDADTIADELSEGSEVHMREELGVNDTTTPGIQKLLMDLDSFQPIPMALVESNDLEASFPDRFQTALHFGSLVADGFVIVINERPQSIQNVGRALLRQARALGVGDSMTRRAASLIDLGQKGDWPKLREELIKTQADVEKAMMNLHDEEMAHLISFGGWLRGFQLAVNATAANYTPERAELLKRLDVMNYFIDRLNTLNPRVKKTKLVTLLISNLNTIYNIVGQAESRPPSQSEVKEMQKLADEMVNAALSKKDSKDPALDAVE